MKIKSKSDVQTLIGSLETKTIAFNSKVPSGHTLHIYVDIQNMKYTYQVTHRPDGSSIQDNVKPLPITRNFYTPDDMYKFLFKYRKAINQVLGGV